jgi:hypothetical protein
MALEIVGELIMGGLELGGEMVTSGDNKKSGWGCLMIIIMLTLIGVGIYFIVIAESEPKPPTLGLVTKKLPDDKMVIKTKKGEDVYTIRHELYLNKKEGDSIILNN